MIKLGITGNIASGKSTLEKFLKDLEIPTIDADRLTQFFLEEDKVAIREVADLFLAYGTNVLDKNGKISRKKLADIVFNDKNKLKDLETILHPKIIKKIKEFLNMQKHHLSVAIVPLLYETGMESLFDYVILVKIDKTEQLERLMRRNNYTKEEAQKRINAQQDQDIKIQKADFVIDNDGSIENTREQLLYILKKAI